jgi:hypothetical protein
MGDAVMALFFAPDSGQLTFNLAATGRRGEPQPVRATKSGNRHAKYRDE